MTCSGPDTRNRRVRTVSRLLMPAAAMAVVVTSMIAAAPATAKPPPVVSTVVNHFETSQYFPADPNCRTPVGVTEIAVGTEHLHVTDHGDTLHVTYGETFRIQEVWDDPSIPVGERQGTDALTFQLVNGGAVQVFHENFHDKPSVWGDIAFYTTFVAVKGEVRVDHFFGRDLPDEGC